MKRHGMHGWTLLMLGAVCLAGAVRAEQQEPPPPKPPEPPEATDPPRVKVEARYDAVKNLFSAFQPDAFAKAVEKVKGSYMGVTTKTADATLRKQLQLPDGVGLVVTYVDPESPAKSAGLEVHDVLKRFDDQILINERQLLTLVRMKKTGEKADLTLFRAGKETKVSVTVAEKDVLPLEAFDDAGMAPANDEMGMRFFNRPVTPHVLSLPNGGTWTQAVALSDPKFNIQVQSRDGKAMLIAKDKDGNVIYEGAGDAVPEEVKERLGDALKFMQVDLDRPPGDVLFMRQRVKPGPDEPKAGQ